VRCTTTSGPPKLAEISTEREKDALVIDGDYYVKQRLQQPALGIRIGKRQAEDESGNQTLPEDHHHGNAAHVCKAGPSVGSGGRQVVGRAVLTRKLPAVDRGAGHECGPAEMVT